MGHSLAGVVFLSLLVGCSALEYDLSQVPVPISAKPADPKTAASIEPLHLEDGPVGTRVVRTE